MYNGRKVFVDKVPYHIGRGFDLRLIEDRFEGQSAKVFCAATVMEVPMGAEVRPLLRLTDEEAQRLIDQLWEAGVRPSNTVGSVGQLAAVQAHLDDMKRIAFKKLGIES